MDFDEIINYIKKGFNIPDHEEIWQEKRTEMIHSLTSMPERLILNNREHFLYGLIKMDHEQIHFYALALVYELHAYYLSKSESSFMKHYLRTIILELFNFLDAEELSDAEQDILEQIENA